MEASVPESGHDRFARWAKDQGIKVNGVRPAKTPNGGLGIIANRSIKAGEELVNVPSSALLTTQSIPGHFRQELHGITTHGLFASFLASHNPDLKRFAAWRETWPSKEDLECSMPMCWASKVLSEPQVLPPALRNASEQSLSHEPLQSHSKACHLLQRQSQKLEKDWRHFSRNGLKADFFNFRYCWLIVNTRCFYYELPGTKKPPSVEDRMVLCPFIDFFNHQDTGCNVTFDKGGFVVTSDRAYTVGQEVYTSYGSHSNDFLLAEYGFILETNRWDSLPLDHLLLDRLNAGEKARLADAGYLGNYTVSSDGVCHRTDVAARLQTLRPRQWEKYVQGNLPENAQRDSKARAFIAEHILQEYAKEAEQVLEILKERKCGIPPETLYVLERRWEQIKDLIANTLGTSSETSE